ncbi:MAG: hypothetical protein HN348_17065 [Proteobacteria bacterium]|jgi:hypothetical protein|nr:hypothetical protein [Pseudomonadota bacterium]
MKRFLPLFVLFVPIVAGGGKPYPDIESIDQLEKSVESIQESQREIDALHEQALADEVDGRIVGCIEETQGELRAVHKLVRLGLDNLLLSLKNGKEEASRHDKQLIIDLSSSKSRVLLQVARRCKDLPERVNLSRRNIMVNLPTPPELDIAPADDPYEIDLNSPISPP